MRRRVTRSPRAPALLVAVLSGCAPAPASPPPPGALSASADDAAGLRVDLRLAASRFARISDLRATVRLTNGGSQPRRLQVQYIEAGNLSLEVHDPSGARVAGMSPPVPRVDDGVTGWVTLAPGASQSFDCSGGIAVDAPPGRYRVRFQGVPGDPTAGELKSGWVSFDVGP